MIYQEILPIAEKYKKILEPYCKRNRCRIAGSIRRKCPDCGDIELVIIREPNKLEELKSVVGEWKRIRGSITGRYTQRMLPEGIKLDIFIAVDDGSNYANILLIRTGNANFSRYMMGIRLREYGYRHHNGFIWKDDNKVICNTEKDIFKLVYMEYLTPEEREY
ncbi:hypothetical protein KAX02_08040 [candidate division WOR-3 bacterium]|nr:hypothetical protein [candidate division WOR-3 bacterium]